MEIGCLKKQLGRREGRPIVRNLLFDNFQDTHGAGLGADAAGDALGGRILFLQHHDLHGAGLNALAAAHAVLLVDHVHAGLGVLGDGIVLTGLHALAALDADIGLCTAILAGDDTDAAVVLVELLVERSGAGADTGQTKKQDVPAAPEPEQAAEPAKVYTYEEVRAILAEKSRTGFRAEVKALLTAHGVKQLSEVTDPEVYAAIVAESEEIGNG